mmetsp:Transcript_167879/g.539233  ORF Transcript_167879/g.539233 Transcript_167879/m.539233 type:complete len:203 (+) Transcript_167879:1985-2593(+)
MALTGVDEKEAVLDLRPCRGGAELEAAVEGADDPPVFTGAAASAECGAAAEVALPFVALDAPPFPEPAWVAAPTLVPKEPPPPPATRADVGVPTAEAVTEEPEAAVFAAAGVAAPMPAPPPFWAAPGNGRVFARCRGGAGLVDALLPSLRYFTGTLLAAAPDFDPPMALSGSETTGGMSTAGSGNSNSAMYAGYIWRASYIT